MTREIARARRMRGSIRATWLATVVTAVALVAGVGVPGASAVPLAGSAVTVGSERPSTHEEPGAPGQEAVGGEQVADGVAAMFGDSGVTVPGTTNEVTGDVLGLGYEQVIRLNGSRVQVLEPVTRGSKELRSFEADAMRYWPRNEVGQPMFYGGPNMADKVVGHSASRLAVVGRYVYVSNLKVRIERGPFGSLKLVPDGSVTRKFTPEGYVLNERHELAEYAVTALDGFVWQGKEFLAIGLNKCGVRVVDPNVAKMPDYRVLFGHWCDRQPEMDQVTALKMTTDERGRFLLVAGKFTSHHHPALVGIDVERNQEIWQNNFRLPGSPWQWPEVVSMGRFGPGDRMQVAVGWPTLGRLSFLDLETGHDRGWLDGGVVSVARFFTDATGQPRIGVRRGTAQGFTSFVAKPEKDKNAAPVITETGDVNALEWMVPGYLAWSVEVENRSRAEISVQSFAGATRGEGCWLGAGLHGVTNPLPAQPASIPPGGRGGPYATAHKIREDSCVHERSGLFYLQVQPAGEPGNRQVVQLQADMHGMPIKERMRIKERVGADRFAVEVAPTSRFGAKVTVTDRHAAHTIVGAPVIEASRLTPAPTKPPVPKPDDPWRPVNRFAVTGVSWLVPGAGGRLAEAALPLPVAEGSVDGHSWEQLGTVASPLAPAIDGDRVTMGAAVFDWQTAQGAPENKDYRYVRVVAGGAASNVIDVTQLAAPEPSLRASSIVMSGAGTPRANGLDQSPLRVSLRDKDRQALDAHDHAALYSRIYYRDNGTDALITGLGNSADPNQLVMFSLEPGQYANEDVNHEGTPSIGVYFSARHSQGRVIRAVFKPNGEHGDAHVGTLPLRPVTSSLLTMGTAANGLSVGSCPESECAVALSDPWVAPAMHSLTATTVTVQLRAIAVPGSAFLPLTAPDNQPPDGLRLVSDTFLFHGTRAMLENPNQFAYNARITTDLVARGERVIAENHYVRAK